jgi:hypothetical protein
VKKILIAAFLTTIMFTQSARSAGTSWITSDFPPNPDMPEIEQAQKWALCAATLEVFAELTREQLNKPATADTIQSYASGAKTAILGVFLMGLPLKIEGKTDAEAQSIFDKTRNYAAMASDSFPELKKKQIISKFELTANTAALFEDLSASAAACLKKDVLIMQQNYIDIVREVFLGVK